MADSEFDKAPETNHDEDTITKHDADEMFVWMTELLSVSRKLLTSTLVNSFALKRPKQLRNLLR